MESRLPKIKSIVKQTANWVIRIMGSLILLFLVWYAMRTLQYMLPVAGHEDLVEIPDSVIRNLAAAALILLLYAVLTAVEKKAGDKITIWCKRIAVTARHALAGNRRIVLGSGGRQSAECRSGIGYWCGHRFYTG